jgi:hypothetical protein
MSERSERMKVASDALFDKCVETNLLKDGTVVVCCKLGRWCVIGIDGEVVRANAMYYWIQYYHDGEYDQMLSNNCISDMGNVKGKGEA